MPKKNLAKQKTKQKAKPTQSSRSDVAAPITTDVASLASPLLSSDDEEVLLQLSRDQDDEAEHPYVPRSRSGSRSRSRSSRRAPESPHRSDHSRSHSHSRSSSANVNDPSVGGLAATLSNTDSHAARSRETGFESAVLSCIVVDSDDEKLNLERDLEKNSRTVDDADGPKGHLAIPSAQRKGLEQSNTPHSPNIASANFGSAHLFRAEIERLQGELKQQLKETLQLREALNVQSSKEFKNSLDFNSREAARNASNSLLLAGKQADPANNPSGDDVAGNNSEQAKITEDTSTRRLATSADVRLRCQNPPGSQRQSDIPEEGVGGEANQSSIKRATAKPVIDEAAISTAAPAIFKSAPAGVGAFVPRPDDRRNSGTKGKATSGPSSPSGTNVPLHIPPPKLKNNATHDDHVAALIRFFDHGDVVAALAQTMHDDGEEDSEAAHRFLLNLRDKRVIRGVLEQHDKEEKAAAADQLEYCDVIREGGELAILVAASPITLNLILHMVEVHSRTRNAHGAEMMRAAANLLAHQEVRKQPDLKIVSLAQQQQIATSVNYDCRTCEIERMRAALKKRQEEEKQKTENLERERAEKKKHAEAARIRVIEEENEKRKQKETSGRKLAATPPLDELDHEGAPFDPRDSKFAKKRKASICWNCSQGNLGGDKEFLYICDVCSHTLHEPCTKFGKVIRTNEQPGSDNWKWACLQCLRALPTIWRAQAPEERSRELTFKIDSTPTSRGPPARVQAAAAVSTAAVGAPPDTANASATGDAEDPFDSSIGSLVNRSTFSSTVRGLNSSITSEAGISFKIESYSLWKPLQGEWDYTKEHTELGFGKSAYLNWKAINLSRRDQAGGKLGPLTTALTRDILVSIGSCLISHPTIRLGRTDLELSNWIRDDPYYNWVKAIPDNDLLRYLDQHFSVLDVDTFLSLRFPNSEMLSPTTEDGDINYFAVALSAFADRWLKRLSDLRSGGWNDSCINLRQAFINALEGQPTLHREATTYQTSSHDLLISHMRQWCHLRETEVNRHARARREAALKASPRPSCQPPPKPSVKDKDKDNVSQQIKALRTEINALQGKERINTARIPSHIDSKTQWWCHGCGKTYSRDGRPIPCDKECVYAEHAEHNTLYRAGKPYPAGKPPLSWGTIDSYKAKYGKEMPPSGKRYLELRVSKYRNPKREREPTASVSNPSV